MDTNQPLTIAAVDLGSNSFRLQIAHVRNGQVYPQDSLKEMVRLAAGLGPGKLLDARSEERALACLTRFGERLRGLPKDAVRAVGTNTLRVAKNAGKFMASAQAALGFPIEIISGHEEARLIHLGVATGLAADEGQHLVVDIGGGSTELIIGAGLTALRTESLYMGCVSYSMRFFADGIVTKESLRDAELAATYELQTIEKDFAKAPVTLVIGSSGTVRAIQKISEANGWSKSAITPKSLSKLRAALLKAGKVMDLHLDGMSEERAPVLAGGFAILSAVFNELHINEMHASDSGLRDGVLYDLIERFQEHDVREATVQEFTRRYHVDVEQAARVESTAMRLFAQLALTQHVFEKSQERFVSWAARLHEIGMFLSYTGFHKHSTYIVENADMPGFSKQDQTRLGLLVYSMRGAPAKIAPRLASDHDLLIVLVLRLATLIHRSRTDIVPAPQMQVAYSNREFNIHVDRQWLRDNLLVDSVLRMEIKTWNELNYRIILSDRKSPR